MQKGRRRFGLGVAVGIGVGVSLLAPRPAGAHCDTLAGPVVTTARAALEKGEVTPVLKWVRKEDEGEIRAAFRKTLIVRRQGPAARELADTYFFETLVRVHRAGEGEPYTGLKPAGAVEPPVAAADQALASGGVEALVKEVTDATAAGTRRRFAEVLAKKQHAEESVPAGREYVAAYVEFIHYVERLHLTATGETAGHGESPGAEAERAAHR
jgi:uncharacterized protein DUF6448